MTSKWLPSIALIGLSGAGKSTVARMLGALLGWFWVDTDIVIVERASRSIAEIFGDEGENHFRKLETQVLEEVLTTPIDEPRIVATGGGIVVREENRAILRNRAYIVWLDATNDVLLQRVRAHSEQRPLLLGDNPRARIEALRQAREALYRTMADQVVDTSSGDIDSIARSIIASYKTFTADVPQRAVGGLQRSEADES